MKIQPPQYLMAGIILLVLGLQFLLVDSYVLSMQASEIVESQLDIPAPPESSNQYTVWLPPWFSWTLIVTASLCFVWTIRTSRREH
jgi:hypothetical protein